MFRSLGEGLLGFRGNVCGAGCMSLGLRLRVYYLGRPRHRLNASRSSNTRVNSVEAAVVPLFVVIPSEPEGCRILRYPS